MRRAWVPAMWGDDQFTLFCPSGFPHGDTWHPGDKVVPLMRCHGRRGLYYQERRLPSEDPGREPELELHLFTTDKVLYNQEVLKFFKGRSGLL